MDNEQLVTDDLTQAVETPSEKMVPQSEVNKLIGGAKAAAAERARAEAARQYQAEIERLKAQAPQGMGGMPAQNPEDLVNQVRNQVMQQMRAEQEKAQQEAYEKEVGQVFNSYLDKMDKTRQAGAYEDFDKVMADFDPLAFPNLVFMASQLENTADVMYELNKSPAKFANIISFLDKSPKMAQKQLEALSQSIKANQQAADNNQSANSPLPRLKPSTTAGGDNGAMTIRDYKDADWLKA